MFSTITCKDFVLHPLMQGPAPNYNFCFVFVGCPVSPVVNDFIFQNFLIQNNVISCMASDSFRQLESL